MAIKKSILWIIVGVGVSILLGIGISIFNTPKTGNEAERGITTEAERVISTEAESLKNVEQASPNFIAYKEESTGLNLSIPEGWTVSKENGTVFVKNNSDSLTQVSFTLLSGVTNKINAVGLANVLLKNAKSTYPDLEFTAKISKAQDVVELNCIFTKQGKKLKGCFMVTLDKGNGIFCGYEAPEENFSSMKGILSSVLASLKLSASKDNSSNTAVDESKNDPNDSIQLYTRSGNASTIDVPEDWSVTGFGLPGSIIAVDIDGSSGFIGQTAAVFPPSMSEIANGNPVSEYIEPAGFISGVYLPLLGNSGVSVEKEVDASSIIEGVQGAEAKIVLANCTSKNGISLKTLILAVTFSPSIVTGQWSALVYGFWTPEEQFDSKFTLMKRISDSYKPNEEEIRRVTAEKYKDYQQGIKKLSQSLSKQLEESYQPSGSGASSDDGISSEERLYQKWNDYAAGEERLYSEVEDKVYTLPAGYDKYNNPQYPDEELSPITNEQWGKEVDRSYLPGGWHN